MGVPEHSIGLIRNLYISNRSYVKINIQYSKVFGTKKIRQDCIISLFNIYREHVIRRILDDWEAFSVNGKRIINLRYADDTMLLVISIDDMRQLIQRLVTESEKVGLINKNKTKLKIIDRTGKLPNIDTIQGIDIVDNLIYLGSYMQG